MKKRILKHGSILLTLVNAVFAIPAAQALSCGDNVVGTVVLAENLNCTTGYTALEVVNNNVTIDLNGFTLSGPNDLSGISVNEYDNLVVKNGSIKGFWVGLNSARSDKLSVSNVTFYENGTGIIISEGNEASIVDNDFIKTSAQAISINVWNAKNTANNNLISRNEFYRAGVGVAICGARADKNVISDNLIWKSGDRGIQLNQSDRNRIYRNRILDTADGAALRLNNSSYNVINDNSVRGGGYAGVTVLGDAGTACLSSVNNRSVKNRFMRNRVADFQYAFVFGLLSGTPHNVVGNGVLDNRINDNRYGIHFRGDTRSNYARDNDFTDTTFPIIDAGFNNHH